MFFTKLTEYSAYGAASMTSCLFGQRCWSWRQWWYRLLRCFTNYDHCDDGRWSSVRHHWYQEKSADRNPYVAHGATIYATLSGHLCRLDPWLPANGDWYCIYWPSAKSWDQEISPP